MSTKKPVPKKITPLLEPKKPIPQEAKPQETKPPEPKPPTPSPEAKPVIPITEPPKPQETPSIPQPEKPKPITLASLKEELHSLRLMVDDHSHLMEELKEIVARKRKPVASNGKVQIKDKKTGTVYPSKNNTYQSLLKSGELKDLVDKGVFGDIPEKNSFGWYTLVRTYPDRFEEIPKDQTAS